jgi:hypothetical protein
VRVTDQLSRPDAFGTPKISAAKTGIDPTFGTPKPPPRLPDMRLVSRSRLE